MLQSDAVLHVAQLINPSLNQSNTSAYPTYKVIKQALNQTRNHYILDVYT